MRKGIHARLQEERTVQELCRAISRYEELCRRKCAPGHNQWSLNELMTKGSGSWIDKLLDPNYPGIRARNGSTRPPPEWLVHKMQKAISAAHERLVGAHDLTEDRYLRQVKVCCGEHDITFSKELFDQATEATKVARAARESRWRPHSRTAPYGQATIGPTTVPVTHPLRFATLAFAGA